MPEWWCAARLGHDVDLAPCEACQDVFKITGGADG